jgi:hypothetical protein
MRALVESRQFLSVFLSAVFGTALFYRMPFPDENSLLQLVWLAKPSLFLAIKWAYVAMLFSTPYIGFSLVLSPSTSLSSARKWRPPPASCRPTQRPQPATICSL